MPQNILDQAVYTTTVVAPSDGDAGISWSEVTGIQDLANRTAFLNAILNVTGVTLLRNGTQAAMQAATGIAPNAVWLASDTGNLWFYNATSSATADGRTILTATGMGTGRWILCMQGAIGGGFGVPQYDGTAKLATTNVHNGLFADQSVQNTSGWLAIIANTTGSAFVDGLSLTVNSVIPGDIVEVVTHFGLQNDSSVGGNTPTASFRVAIIDGAANVFPAECQVQAFNDRNGATRSEQYDWFTVGCRYVAVNSSNMVIKQQVAQLAGGSPVNAYIVGPSTLDVRVYRP